MIKTVAEEFRSPTQRADELPGVGIDQQLVRIKPMARVRLEGPVHAIAVHGARPRGRQVAVPHFIGVFGKFDALQFGFAGVIEQTQLDFRRVSGKQREIDTEAVPSRAKWKWLSLADLGAAQDLRSLRK